MSVTTSKSATRLSRLTLTLLVLLPFLLLLQIVTQAGISRKTHSRSQRNVNEDTMYSDYHCYGWDFSTRSCMFTNVCFTPTKGRPPHIGEWSYFYRKSPPSSIPPATSVTPEGTVGWLNMSTWTIKMATSYNHIKEPDDGNFEAPFLYDFRFKHMVEDALPRDNETVYLREPHFMAARTKHDDNLGHLVFDSYFPILTVIESFLGSLRTSRDVTVIDVVNENRVFSKWYRSIYKKWLDLIANSLFKEWITETDFWNRYRRNVPGKTEAKVCFRQLIVGCWGLSGLSGQTLHRQHIPEYIRETLWRRFVPSNVSEVTRWSKDSAFPRSQVDVDRSLSKETETKEQRKERRLQRKGTGGRVNTTRLNVLMLEKTDTHWNHVNHIKNWSAVVECVKKVAGAHSSVLSIAPQKVPFDQQVRLFKEADVVVSLWGGISMLNFLMPRNSVEVLFSSWFENLMPMPNTTADIRASLPCPDFDDRARSSFQHKVLLYCSRDDGMRSNAINLTNFEPFIQHVLEYRRSVVADGPGRELGQAFFPRRNS